MRLQKEACLSPGSSLQIRYPEDWSGEKSGDEDATELFISSNPKYITSDEIKLIKDYLTTISQRRNLILTGAVLVDPEDPLLEATQEELDAIELQEKLENSKTAPGGGTLPTYARVLRIREQGYQGSKHIALKGVNQ